MSDRGDWSFQGINEARRILEASCGRQLAAWRHAITIMATVAVDTLCWAQLHEALVALTEAPLPPSLVRAMLSPRGDPIPSERASKQASGGGP